MNIEPWNLRALQMPSENTRLYDRENLNLVIIEANKMALSYSNVNSTGLTAFNLESFLQKFKSVLLKMNQNIKMGIKYLKLENTALFAFLYQNGRHRGEKFMQVIKKLVKCMKNWEDINLYLLITNHLQMFPAEFINIQRVRLPTTDSLYFLLLRLLGSYLLMMKTSSYCLQAAYYLRSKLVTGHFFANATVAFAFVARIRALCLEMAFTIAESYDEVHPILNCLFKVCSDDKYPALPYNLKEDFREDLPRRSNAQKNCDESEIDIESHNMQDLGITVEKDDSSESVDVKKTNLASNTGSGSSNKIVTFNTDKRLEHDKGFSGSTTFSENEDLGVHVSEKNYALFKKVMSRTINRSNKQMKNLSKEGKVNKKKKKVVTKVN